MKTRKTVNRMTILFLLICTLIPTEKFGAHATKPAKIFTKTNKDIIPVKTYKTVMDFFDVKSKLKTTLNTCPMRIDLGKIRITLDKNGLTAKKIKDSDSLESISLAKKIDDDIAKLTTVDLVQEYCRNKLKHRLFDATSTFSSSEVDESTIEENNNGSEQGTNFATRVSILDSGIMALEKLQELCNVDESTIANAQTTMLKRLDLISMKQPTGELPCAWNFCINAASKIRIMVTKIIIGILVAIEITRNTISRFNINKNAITRKKPRRIELNNEDDRPTKAKKKMNRTSTISYFISFVIIIFIVIPSSIYQDAICGRKIFGKN
jgi:hypothetical protein